MVTILMIRDHTCLQSCAPDFVCFYFSICKLTMSSSRFCVLLLLNLQAHNFELQKSRAYNLVVNILYASTSQFVHLILALITHHKLGCTDQASHVSSAPQLSLPHGIIRLHGHQSASAHHKVYKHLIDERQFIGMWFTGND